MKRLSIITFIVALAAGTAACNRFDNGDFYGRGGSEGRETGSGDTLSLDGIPIIDTVIYVSSVEYPDGYDWVKDTEYGEVEGTISLYRNAVKVAEVTTSFRHNVSPEADMHRIMGGHLYTDFSNDDETVIKKDGEEIIRYPGRESIKGFLLKDGQVHTLGQNRDGRGFNYRIDGTVVFSSETGRIIGEINDGGWPTGALYEDAGEVVFAYNDSNTYHLYQDGLVEVVSFPHVPRAVFDIRRVNGRILATARINKIINTFALVDGKGVLAEYGGFDDMASGCNILYNGERVLVKAVVPVGTRNYYMLWDEDNVIWMSNDIYEPIDYYADGGRVDFVAHIGDVIYFSDKGSNRVLPVHGRCKFLSSRCGTHFGGKLYAVLTGTGSTPNKLIEGDKVVDLGIPGLITGMEIRLEERSQSSQ